MEDKKNPTEEIKRLTNISWFFNLLGPVVVILFQIYYQSNSELSIGWNFTPLIMFVVIILVSIASGITALNLSGEAKQLAATNGMQNITASISRIVAWTNVLPLFPYLAGVTFAQIIQFFR